MEKDIFNIDKNKLSYGRGYVYSLQYHLVWCTKYRKKVLKNGIDTECKEMLQNLAEEYKFQILAMEVMPDHIDRKSTRLNSSHIEESRMPSSA